MYNVHDLCMFVCNAKYIIRISCNEQWMTTRTRVYNEWNKEALTERVRESVREGDALAAQNLKTVRVSNEGDVSSSTICIVFEK